MDEKKVPQENGLTITADGKIWRVGEDGEIDVRQQVAEALQGIPFIRPCGAALSESDLVACQELGAQWLARGRIMTSIDGKTWTPLYREFRWATQVGLLPFDRARYC